MKQREGEIRWDVERTSDTEHLKMRELAEGRSESWIEIELVHKLEQTHHSDNEREVRGVQTDAPGFVRTEVRHTAPMNVRDKERHKELIMSGIVKS